MGGPGKFDPRCVHHTDFFKKIETLWDKGHGRSNRFTCMELFLGTRVEHTEKFSKNRIFLNENAKNHQNLKVKFFGRGCAPQGKEIAQNECYRLS